MIDPATIIRNQLDLLIAQQIGTLRKPSSLTPEDLDGFTERLAKIKTLFRELDKRKPMPTLAHRSKLHVHPAA